MDMVRVMQPMISVSPVTLFLSPLSLSLTLWTLCGATTAKQIKGCQTVCEKTRVGGLVLSGVCETVCPDGVISIDEFKEPVDNALAGKRKESDSGTDFIQGNHKRQKLEDDINISSKSAAEKSCNYELLQNSGKRGLFETEASGDLAVNVGLEITNDGEYILKIKKSVPSSTEENELKRAKQMAQNAAMLSFYGEMLQDVGEKLHAQSRALLRSIFEVPAPYYSKSD